MTFDMSPIKLALCITELDAGGAERCLTELAVRADREQFHPIVYALSPPPEREEESFLPRLRAAGVEVHFLGGSGILHFPKVVHRLKKLWIEHQPKVVQTFLFHANIVGRIAAKRAGVGPVLAGVRVAERSASWHLWLDRATKNTVERYVCVSRAVADFTVATLGVPADRITVIPNGIDLERFPSPRPANLHEFGIAAGRRVAVFVGRLEEQKGVKWLIESAPAWLNRSPDCNLLLVGDGPLRESLMATANSLGIGDRVHFAGWRADVPEILAAADLLVLPLLGRGCRMSCWKRWLVDGP